MNHSALHKKILSGITHTAVYDFWLPVILFVLNIIVLHGYCLSPFWENLLTGSVISFIFYFMVVYIPNYVRKQNLKKVFLDFYDEFKESVIRDVLTLAEFNGDFYEQIEQLKNIENFASYCGASSRKRGQTNWDLVQDNIDEEDYRYSLRNIVIKIDELRREVDFLVRSAGVGDQELLKRFRNLDRVLQDGRYTTELDWNQGDDDRFTGSLYELLSGWSFVTGTQSDFVKEWVQKL